jgi:hypothetical protein
MIEPKPGESPQLPDLNIDQVPNSPTRRKFFWRFGCFSGLMLWLVLMVIPPILFILALRGDITIPRYGDVPDRHEYPLFQVKLIMEDDFRGLGLMNTKLFSDNDLNMCIQTNVSYFLWEGEGEPAVFCACYNRENDDMDWVWLETVRESCSG